MSVASFTSAATVDDALAALAAGARPVAGGTDLVVGARQGKAPLPERIVAIDRVAELSGISELDGALHLGALATHSEIATHPLVRERFTALADASAIVGSRATRAHGTIGGNLMNASPAMETGGPLQCLDASVMLQSSRGSRWVPVAELFGGPGATTAQPDELLVAVDVPAPAEGTASAYVRLEYRRQMEIAVVGATAAVTLAGGAVSAARVAITALAPTIRRVPEAEAALESSDGGEAAVAAAAAAAAAASAPISDVRASEGYRRAMAEVIARRAIEAALARGRGELVPIPASSGGTG
ncbi:MAG: FAD binding domain-containing protein [Thermoleophilia bacterium]|nr:FAD binding domain-containing protein [Thermoleophilia bacterium]MDH5333740.1 FAD binding domain-containing protein [Thermoleophilia bacterium]